MIKNAYRTPQIEFVQIEDNDVIATSGGTGARGEDVPWAARRNDYSFDEEFIGSKE